MLTTATRGPSPLTYVGRKDLRRDTPRYGGHTLNMVAEFEGMLAMSRVTLRSTDYTLDEYALDEHVSSQELYGRFRTLGIVAPALIRHIADTDQAHEFSYLFIRQDCIVSVVRRDRQTGIFVHPLSCATPWGSRYRLLTPA
ncbi:MAG TPA: hypothetical protein VHO23_01840 [Candidatus Paceibacterota bacterium]|nr:hypothetical protein [Candidatus Paceibacterota bacterium]